MGLFENNYKLVRNGYVEFAPDLVRLLLKDLNDSKDLTNTQREYLIDCLGRSLKENDANKGFYFKIAGRGKKKHATGVRDLHAYMLMEYFKSLGFKHEKCLEQVAEQINLQFPEMIDVKTIEAIYTKGKKNNGKFSERALF